MTEDDAPVRPCTAADLPGLLALYRHLAPGNPPPAPAEAEAILGRIAAVPGSAVLVAAQAGRVLASCTLMVIPNLTRGGRPFGLIENVVTDPAYRGRGHGTRLLDAASAAAWAAGCYKVMLLTGSSRPTTLDFYRRAGFAQTKTGFQKRRAEVECPGDGGSEPDGPRRG
ncbi:GNAT family N-acetyltransferase [Frigidibacter sp. MR17.24]|uniref:GNAT family N-acetyltransferase n=1 Tax=Frigidibacter sp. MR17.24 TaxID=3127345 RepID=UPI003012C063